MINGVTEFTSGHNAEHLDQRPNLSIFLFGAHITNCWTVKYKRLIGLARILVVQRLIHYAHGLNRFISSKFTRSLGKLSITAVPEKEADRDYQIRILELVMITTTLLRVFEKEEE